MTSSRWRLYTTSRMNALPGRRHGGLNAHWYRNPKTERYNYPQEPAISTKCNIRIVFFMSRQTRVYKFYIQKLEITYKKCYYNSSALQHGSRYGAIHKLYWTTPCDAFIFVPVTIAYCVMMYCSVWFKKLMTNNAGHNCEDTGWQKPIIFCTRWCK